MHGTVNSDRFDMSRKSSIAMCALGSVVGIVIYKLHVAQKWDAAFVCTFAAIWYLAGVFRSRWNRASFWIAFVGCFAAHIAFTWFVFAIMMRDVDTVGILVWIPIAMPEVLGLYYLIDLLDRKLSNERAG
jgi:hypothetical protein